MRKFTHDIPAVRLGEIGKGEIKDYLAYLEEVSQGKAIAYAPDDRVKLRGSAKQGKLPANSSQRGAKPHARHSEKRKG